MNTSAASFLRTVLVLVTLSACQNRDHKTSSPLESAVADEFTKSQTTPDDADKPSHSDMRSMRIAYKDLDPEIQVVIRNLKDKKPGELASAQKPFIILKPGPGLYPVVGYGKGAADLNGVDEYRLLVQDFPDFDNAIYRLLPDKCSILETFPDGLYISEAEPETIDIQTNPDDEVAQGKLKNVLNEWGYKKTVEVLIKFNSVQDEDVFFHFFLFKDRERLQVGIIDQRTCGA